MKNLQTISRTIASFCAEQPSIMAAYIFGSIAKGSAKASSDIDVAVLLDHKKQNDSPDTENSFSLLSFITDLEKSLECRVDLVVLNRVSELLKFEVRRSGILVFERSSGYRKNFEIKSRKLFQDFLYLHKRYVKNILYGEKNG
ncbi:DNA polymerase, beta domain protein region [Candidatus Magnetomoraceae bacterium gMMP-15]